MMLPLPYSLPILYLAAWLARLVLGTIFLFAGVSKLRQPARFVEGVRAYAMVPAPLASAVAGLLIVTELILGIGLLAGVLPHIFGLASLALVAVFALAVGVNLSRGHQVECHCFGASTHERAGPGTLMRLAVMAVMAGIVAGLPASAGVGWAPADLLPVEVILVIMVVLTSSLGVILVALVVDLWWDIIDTRRRGRPSASTGNAP